MTRELTYSDDAHELLADAPPDTSADEPTTLDASRFLAALWDRASETPPYRLRLREAVERLREEFGGRFLCGPAGQQWIDPRAVEAFERRVGPAVVFDPAERSWRWRHQGDVPDGEKSIG